MKSTTIASNIHDYRIYYESDLHFIDAILKTENAIFIIDSNVFNQYPEISGKVVGSRLIRFDATEGNKNLEAAEKIIDSILQLKPNKKTAIISVGGGITQDVTGFAASVFYRGLRWIYVPTTLLAQADSCMGSKTSLNYKSFKNILGTFYPPHEVYICPKFLLTLRAEDFYSGMGEVAKLHLMSNERDVMELLGKMESVGKKDIEVMLGLIQHSLEIKLTYIQGDEFDSGRRNLLNYGHCFGHAIESATKYKIPHGQAIIIGMMIANNVSAGKGRMSQEMNLSLQNGILFPLLKTDYKMLKFVQTNLIIDGMKQDKKRVGAGLPLILLKQDHSLEKMTDLSEEEAGQAYNQFITQHC
jgi:3-dehydroquinate synthase